MSRFIVKKPHGLISYIQRTERLLASKRWMPRSWDVVCATHHFLIIEEEKPLVRYALHWLLFYADAWSSVPDFSLSAGTLADACSLFDTIEGHGYGPFDMESLKESCGCLVRFEPQEKLDSTTPGFEAKIAHYTVREFLESERSATHHANFFSGGTRHYHGRLVCCCPPNGHGAHRAPHVG
ncbi:hypothetical protein B0T21DRAFT_356624 [Apiosordaria backusii]|uniref:Uncharacterized protein n=1 Tax=Apiosordaria backusii TaxID=314023 RepID=A0AA40K750_9PEZI|nr:hypothetical protein B0T21DRAFT_356624 [Apiosordaria backusii]